MFPKKKKGIYWIPKKIIGLPPNAEFDFKVKVLLHELAHAYQHQILHLEDKSSHDWNFRDILISLQKIVYQ